MVKEVWPNRVESICGSKSGKGSVYAYRWSQDYCPRLFFFLSPFFLFYYCVCKSKTDLKQNEKIFDKL